MKFIYGKNDWKSMERGQENCYLLTNGLGGYSSLTTIGSNTRNDHALLMACTIAPNHRYHMITNTQENLTLGEQNHVLSSQEYVNFSKNQKGYHYLNQFSYDDYPTWIYQVDGIEIKKQVVMVQGKNTIVLSYTVTNNMALPVTLCVTPQMQFVAKGEIVNRGQKFDIQNNRIESNGLILHYHTNGVVSEYDTEYEQDLYYSYDARDGRDAIGVTAHNHNITISITPGTTKELNLIYATEGIDGECDIKEYFYQEESRRKNLIVRAQVKSELAKQLVKSTDQYLVKRESTGGKSLMAGYPFFADWGRDTMISMIGCCISTRRFEEAKSIFRTFMQYEKNGLMPNMFPEGGSEPLYNTVDASLLFIGAVYEYYLSTKDVEFIKEAYPVMQNIIDWYHKGTDYHIKMDSDGLIIAGSGLEQVTWMDVRYGEILPTPRHGKPVEINAYWYNDLKIMDFFARLLQKSVENYDGLSALVLKSFREKFWNEKENCLKDLVSGQEVDEQIRCNQIWAVSQPFSLLEREDEIKVVNKVFETLYTPYGLRSLSKYDKDFKAKYGGTHFNRDMAYHQGTVWAFPLGAYYLAYLKVNNYSDMACRIATEQLSVLEACMREGCIGQLAEIYDGDNPSISQGCFAQAWSVSELLRVFVKLEQL